MIEFLKAHPEIWSYVAIPIISAIVGWGTNVLALKMTFYPLEFMGVPPYLGWQGIIPSKAGIMAGKSVDLMTSKLIHIEDQFARINPKRVAEEMEDELNRLSKKIIDEVMETQASLLWLATPKSIKDEIYGKTAEALPSVIEEMMEDLKMHVNDVFDLKAMVIKALLKDKQLLNEIFLRCGELEFKFIKRSGLYFGFFFGIIQAVIWYFYSPWWLLPLAGLFVGYATNWLALKLIFHPLKPIKIGPLHIQGLFIKRQKEVAKEYSKIVTKNILTSRKIFDSIMHGKRSEKLAEMLHSHVIKVVDFTAGSSKVFIELVSGKKKYEVAKNIAFSSFMEDLRITMSHVYDYAEEALNLENTLREKMSGLTPEEFQGFLRPVFQEDETKLILVGAFLGCMAGFMQYYFFF